MLVAAVAAGALARAVFGQLAVVADRETLARSLPGPLAEVVERFAGAPLLPAVFVALVPPLVWVACGAIGAAVQGNEARARRPQALVWLGSLCVSVATLASGLRKIRW